MKKLKHFKKALFMAALFAVSQIALGQDKNVDNDQPFSPPPTPPVLSNAEHTITSSGVSFYPNPCKETLNITLADDECSQSDVLTIYNITGKLVWQRVVNQQSCINISEFVTGVYIINCRGKSYKFQKV